MAIYKLGDICSILNGTKVTSNNGHIPIVGSGGVFGYTNKSKTKGSSISLPRKGTMDIHFYDYPVWNVDTTYLIDSVNSDIVNIKYLFYLLQNNEWKKLITGSTRPAMTKSDWGSYTINLPPLSEQEKIIEIIKPIEEMIDVLNKINLNLYKEADFIYLSSKKFSVNVKDLDIKYGKSIPEKTRIPGKVKLYASNGIIDYVSESITSKPSIIIGCRGVVGSVNWDFDNIMVLNTAFYLECDEKELANYYFAIKNIDGFKQRATGAAQPQLTITNINDMSIDLLYDSRHLHTILRDINNNNLMIQNLTSQRETFINLLIS